MRWPLLLLQTLAACRSTDKADDDASEIGAGAVDADGDGVLSDHDCAPPTSSALAG